LEKLANFIYNRARLIIIIAIILNLISLASFSRFSLDTDFVSFFSEGNPKAADYNRIMDKYQSGETISILVENDVSLLDKNSLPTVFELQEEIRSIDGISQVQSFLPPQIIVDGEIIIVDRRLIDTEYELLGEFIVNEYFLTEQFLSPDLHKGILVTSLQLDTNTGDVINALKDLADNENDLTLSLAGNEVIKDTISGYLKGIMVILIPCAVLLVLIVFYIALRKRLFTILSLIPAAFAALWTFGTLFWSGQELNIITVISPIFIFVMGSAFGLHYVSHFSENMRIYSDRRQLTVETLRIVGTPTFLAAITTMAGFASLTWTEVIPMRNLGIFVTIGIGYAGLIALFFLPALLSRLKVSSATRKSKNSSISELIFAVSRHRSPVIIVFVIIAIVSLVYAPRIEVISDQLMFFKSDSEIRKNFDKVEEYFGGASPLTGEIIAPDARGALSDYDFATSVLATERELEAQSGIKSAFSIFDLIKGTNRMITGEDTYPQNPAVVDMLLTQIGSDNLDTWVSNNGLRLTVRTQDFKTDYIESLESFTARHQDTIGVITGMPVLFDEMNRLVVQSQVQSLALALALIFIMLLLTLRRLRAALAGMLPIAITIAAIMGMLSITNFNLNIMTANLSAICIGVGIDYSIHLISGIYYFRNSGMENRQSVNSAISSVSRPILANAFGLAIGLSVLFFSPIRLHIHAAAIIWVAMLVSSMAALLLIPMFYTGGKDNQIN